MQTTIKSHEKHRRMTSNHENSIKLQQDSSEGREGAEKPGPLKIPKAHAIEPPSREAPRGASGNADAGAAPAVWPGVDRGRLRLGPVGSLLRGHPQCQCTPRPVTEAHWSLGFPMGHFTYFHLRHPPRLRSGCHRILHNYRKAASTLMTAN